MLACPTHLTGAKPPAPTPPPSCTGLVPTPHPRPHPTMLLVGTKLPLQEAHRSGRTMFEDHIVEQFNGKVTKNLKGNHSERCASLGLDDSVK